MPLKFISLTFIFWTGTVQYLTLLMLESIFNRFSLWPGLSSSSKSYSNCTSLSLNFLIFERHCVEDFRLFFRFVRMYRAGRRRRRKWKCHQKLFSLISRAMPVLTDESESKKSSFFSWLIRDEVFCWLEVAPMWGFFWCWWNSNVSSLSSHCDTIKLIELRRLQHLDVFHDQFRCPTSCFHLYHSPIK